MEKKLSWFIDTRDYDEKIGGFLVQHDLAEKLIELGDVVFMSVETPVKGVQKINLNDITTEQSDNIIFVTTETVNKLNSRKKIVRRILYKLGGFFGYNGFYSTKELVTQYGRAFTIETKYENVPELTNYVFDENIWKDKGYSRSKEDLILIKKGNFTKNEKTHKGIIIDQPRKPNEEKVGYSNFELSELFNKHERFITYDNETFHSIQAAMCGCVSIVIPDGSLNEEEWRNSNPIRKWGIAFGDSDEQIEFAKSTVDKLKKVLFDKIEEGKQQIKQIRKMAMEKFPDENSVTCIISTKWEKLFLIDQLQDLLNNSDISQIIILDKNKKNRPSWIEFKNIEIIETDLNTLPAYEIAVEKSVNNILMFVSDDIKFQSVEITKKILSNKHALGVNTLHPTSLLYSHEGFGFYNSENGKKYHQTPDLYLEKLFFIKKENWIHFPGLKEQGLKEWILKCHRPINYFITSNKIELTDFDLLEEEHKKDDEKIIKRILN